MVIVGGGLSGLAAGVTLAARGKRVLVLEQKPQAGGRAYSFRDPGTGDVIDNGQHLLIAGYARTLHFLDTIGALGKVHIQARPELLFHHPVRGFQRMRFPELPSPWHAIPGILGSDLLSVSDRFGILRAGRDILFFNEERARRFSHLTVHQWLDLTGQSPDARQSFWDPLSISIMNEQSDRASAITLLRSLKEAFFGSWHNAAAVLPRVGLSELFVDDAVGFIARHGGTVRCSIDVTELVLQDGAIGEVRLKNGDAVQASAVILAVPWYRLDTLLSQKLKEVLRTERYNVFGFSPIVSVHLWFEADFMPDDFIGLVGRRVQWLFNRRLIMGESGKGGHISAVISAAHEYVGMTNEELVHLAIEDTQSVYPGCLSRTTHAVVIREKRATFSLSPDCEALRPDQRTPIPNLFLAGDWTNTGLPGTIEGAIVSGERCAELAMNH